MICARRAQTLFLMLLLAGCLSATVGGQFLAGRRGLLVGDPESALAYLSAAADQNPNYVNVIENYRESVWTYLGRAQYETKRYAEARKSLERAMTTDAEPSMAKLYLGLTFLRTGDAAGGVKEVEAGMKGLYDWIEYMNRSRPFQAYWDPTYQIRKTIDQALATVGGKDSNLENLMADGEWVGKKFEEELDKVRDDERRQLQRDFDRRSGSGGSFGFGIGF